MSGLRDRFVVGDRVAQVRRIAQGLDKRRDGRVVAVGAKGVQIKFDDGAELWSPPHGLEMVEAMPRGRTPRLAVVEVAAVEVEPTPATADEVIARAESSGVDIVALWRALGAGLTQRKRKAVEESEAALLAAESDVREAEALLADARRALAAARAAAEAARTDLAQVEQEMGVRR